MYLALRYDGSYKNYKSINKLYDDINNTEYVIIDNSTSLKGPLYTMVEASKLTLKYHEIEVIIKVQYNCIDCPFSDYSLVKSLIEVDSIEKYYSIYPLIHQLLNYNFFINDCMSEAPSITINEIYLKSDKFTIELNIDMYGENKFRRVFKKLNMLTCVSKAIDDGYLIMSNDKWSISNDVPDSFDYIGIPVRGSESLYILNKKDFKRFNSIQAISIKMNDSSIYDDSAFYEVILNDRDGSEVFEYECCSLDDIFQTCVYFPQLLSLEYYVYGNNVSLDVLIETDTINYQLMITEKEAIDGICIFDIINKLLKI